MQNEISFSPIHRDLLVWPVSGSLLKQQVSIEQLKIG